MTRRQFLAAAGLTAAAGYAIEAAYRADPAQAGGLSDIDHFVLLMQENRSFDHYFGAMSGVRGFDEPSPVYRQYGWERGRGPSPRGYLLPFRLDLSIRPTSDAYIVNDPNHGWSAMHDAWHDGALDRILATHVRTDGAAAPAVMGYYTRADLPVHYGLADAFTVCDQYFCSVLGATVSNRLYWMTGTLDPDGVAGGPVLGAIDGPDPSWRTFPENLQDAGVSWKVYNAPGSRYQDLSGTVGRFAQYQNPDSELYRRGVAPTYPADFLHDVATGNLPAVSWLIPSMPQSEHPAYPPAVGADEIVRVLSALVARPEIWERTALIVSYDENGGFFDHVPPPTPPAGTPGEFVYRAGRAEPIGLGFRVPCLVLSPYTRGGLVSSAVLDHTSQLRLLASRFDVPVPNLSPWRATTVGDMVSIFRGRRLSPRAVPRFAGAGPAAAEAEADDRALRARGSSGHGLDGALPPNVAPRQETEPRRRLISGP